MNLLLIILAIVVIAALLAFVIVKFLPLKLRSVVSILLLVASVFLVWKIHNGIMVPIEFKEHKEVRYTKVIEKLKLIRDIQEKYKQAKGLYSNNEDTLVNFVKNGKLALTETRNEEKTVHVGGGITKKISVRKVDTVGYEPVAKFFKDRNVENLFTVPLDESLKGKDTKFEVEIGTVEKVKGVFVPVFFAKVEKVKVLEGLDKNEIKNELLRIENNEVKGEFISVGSLDEVSVSGNWPPLYDGANKKEEGDKK